MQNLKLDRRLIRRRDWISKPDLEQALEALPDVSSKSAPMAAPAGEADAGPAKPQGS
jgi:hypothetical protein